MKITTFDPLIVTSKAEELMNLFQELGFERTHKKDGIDGQDITNNRMKDANGFHVDVVSSEQLPQDITMIRMNVDNFDEVFELLTAKGFTNRSGHIVNSSSAKSAMMVSPSGFAIVLAEHIKNHD